MKILSVSKTESDLSRVGRRVHQQTGFAIPGGEAYLVEVDGELERCGRVSTERGTWTVLGQQKGNRLVLLASARGAPHVGDELRIGVRQAPGPPMLDLSKVVLDAKAGARDVVASAKVAAPAEAVPTVAPNVARDVAAKLAERRPPRTAKLGTPRAKNGVK